MKRILFFQPTFSGHALEYINHLYAEALNGKEEYVFYLNPLFKKHQTEFSFANSERIEVIYQDDLLDSKFNKGSKTLRSYRLNSFLRNVICSYRIASVFLISYDHYYPLLPFFLVNGVNYSGIYYFIYLYKWKKVFPLKGYLQIRKQALLMREMSRRKNVQNIYICNDHSSSVYLNKLFGVNKFRNLVDPYNSIYEKEIDPKHFLTKHNIPSDKLIVAHFGALDYRKGTLEILKAIQMLPKTISEQYVFVFAGEISERMKPDFYQELEKSKSFCNVIVWDRFCSEQTLAAICRISSLLLMPYKNTMQSSGMFGYAAQFNVPVAAPNTGLIGKILRRYKLGYPLAGTKVEHIADFLNIFPDQERKPISVKYIQTNNRKEFVNQIFINL